LHGGRSTGAKSQEGRAKIAAANLKTGEFTKEKIAFQKEQAKIARDIRAQIKVIEHRLRREGIID
jgi:plasmid replication initiation protein